MRSPHPGVTVRLQLGSDALTVSSPAAARLEDSQQVLHVVPVFVGQDVGLGERAAFRTEPRLKLLEEPQVDVDTLVNRTVKGATWDDAGPHPVWMWPLKNTVGTTV